MNSGGQKAHETEQLKSRVRSLGVDLVGMADLRTLAGMPSALPLGSFLDKYPYAIVMGAQMGKLGPRASGAEMSFFLERAASDLTSFLIEQRRLHALTVHTEDEFDPIRRTGLMSLKVLAKAAGLGWQGRSLLVVSPDYGPIHRLIAVLTNLDLKADAPLPNRCNGCSLCVESCPSGALTLTSFADHPSSRDEVLDMEVCLGDHGCDVCLTVCPWQKGYAATGEGSEETLEEGDAEV